MVSHLVLIETSSNQRFLFSTNKLRECVGASEAISRVGSRLVELAKGDACVVLQTSGKALLLVSSREAGEAVVRRVTARALEETPGLDLTGVVSDGFDLDKAPIQGVMREVHERFEQVRAARPGPDLRFQRLPIVDECTSSGLPASLVEHGEGRSLVSQRKRELFTAWRERLRELQHPPERSIKDREDRSRELLPSWLYLPERVDQLEEHFSSLEWLGVVHADGNGFGQIFLNFHDYLVDKGTSQGSQREQNERYIRDLSEFSERLEKCCVRAFRRALEVLGVQNRWTRSGRIIAEKACVPLVLGGDDLTAICDGHEALPFARAFLRAFSEETAQDELVGAVTRRAYGEAGLGACAGVTLIKPHFPFSMAYELAESLCSSAKKVKETLGARHSALDVHVLRDSSFRELGAIRETLEAPDGALLYRRPIVVSDDEPGWDDGKRAWFTRRDWKALRGKQKLLGEVPRTQLHELRLALFAGKAEADARLKLIAHRYRALNNFCEAEGSLFSSELHEGQARQATGFLDAMELSGFLGGEEG